MSAVVIIDDSDDDVPVSQNRGQSGDEERTLGSASKKPKTAHNGASSSSLNVASAPIDLEADKEEPGKGNVHVRQETNREASTSGRDSSQKWIAPFQLLRANGIPDYANRSPTGMRLRDVLCGDILWVLVSNFMVDMGWLLIDCPELRRAGFVQVVHGESHPTMLKLMIEEAALVGLHLGENLAIHAPPLPIPYGTHHSKAFLIQYETGMRVVIHTANLVHCDNNFKSQGLWTQDFPKKDESSPPSSDFERDLLDYLRSLQIPTVPGSETIVAKCKQYDFSSARVHIIASRPGRHAGPVGHKILQMRLSKEKFASEYKKAPVFAQFSSLGSLDQKWLHQEFQQTLSSGFCQSATGRKEPLGSSTQDSKGFQLIWPTVNEVRNSLEGWAAGRSIPGYEKNVKKPFLQSLWHRFGGEPMVRQRAMPHIKTYGRYLHIPGQGTKLAWFVLASHNLSKAAWGNLQAGQTMFIRSYELGVLFLPSLELAYRAHRHCGFTCTKDSPIVLPSPGKQTESLEFWTKDHPDDPKDQDTKMYFPLPYKLPAQIYQSGDKPWMADFPFPGLDCYGRSRDGDFPAIYVGSTAAATETEFR